MIQLDLHPSGMSRPELKSWIHTRIKNMPVDTIVKIKVYGTASQDTMELLRAASLRALAPPTMNIDARFVSHTFYRRHF
jgi:hypothetical protein